MDRGLSERRQPQVIFVTDRNLENSSDWKSIFGSKTLAVRNLRCGEVKILQDDPREVGQLYDERKLIVDVRAIVTGRRSCVDFIHEKAVADAKGINVSATVKAEPGTKFLNEKSSVDTSTKNILVLLHGYNNNFRDSIRRAVGFAQDINFDGLLVVWSWPSEGWEYAYKHNVAANDYSSENFSSFFRELRLKDQSLHIDYIAHSMGGRILLKFLFDNHEHVDGYSTFAAPDVDSAEFRNQASAASVPLITLYASAYDYALMMSKIYNLSRSPRAGAGGSDIIVLPGMDSVNVNLSGHVYVFEHPSLLRDFRRLENEHRNAASRGLTPRTRGSDTYYVINP